MLSLLDPVEFEDLVIFRDDVETNKFYLLPDQPIVPLDDEGNAEFLFLKFIKDVDAVPDTETDMGGGLLQFRTVLTIGAERRQRVIAALKARLEQEKAAGRRPFGIPITSTDPLLAAPLWVSGKVTMSTFKVSDTGMVRYATESALADLAGDLGASLSLDLSPDGADVFWSAFQNRDERKVPIVVTYELTYRARVSARMEIHAKREVIQQRIEQAARPYRLLTAGFVRYAPVPHTGPFAISMLPQLTALHGTRIAAMVPRYEIPQIINKTIVDHDIEVKIQMDEAGAGEDANKLRELLFKLATDVLADRIVPALFGQEGGKPGASDPGASRANLDLLEIRPGGSPANISFDLVLDHQTVVERQVNPNGPVEVMIASPEALQRSFKELRLSDGFFRLLRVTANTAGVNFEKDNIDTVQVFLKYDQVDEANPARPRVFRDTDRILANETDAVHWKVDMARGANGGHKSEYEYRTEVHYKDGPISRSEWQRASNRFLLLTPRAMGALRVELVLTSPKGVVDSARVEMKRITTAGETLTNAIELLPDGGPKTWFQFTGELAPPGSDVAPLEYSYRVSFRSGGNEVMLPWKTSRESILAIPSPFKRVLNFILRPQGSFDGVNAIEGDVYYEDSERQYKIVKSFSLPNLTASFNFDVPIFDGGPEKARWKARMVRADGSSEDLGSNECSPGTVWIGPEVLAIEIRTELLDFETDVRLAIVEMIYADPSRSTPTRKTFTFSKTARDPITWRVNRPAGGPTKYDVRVRFAAYDRTKDSEKTYRQIEDQVFLLDRAQ